MSTCSTPCVLDGKSTLEIRDDQETVNSSFSYLVPSTLMSPQDLCRLRPTLVYHQIGSPLAQEDIAHMPAKPCPHPPQFVSPPQYLEPLA